MTSIALDLSGVVVTYRDVVALAIEELHISGRVIAVLGHNGAGKSTLMKYLLGVHPAKHGKARVTQRIGSTVCELTPQRDMAFCPEMGAVFEDISVRDYLSLWSRLRFDGTKHSPPETEGIVRRLSIDVLFHKRGRELSKGERRRVHTAIGFLTKPKLFLFDEPFDGLDISRTEELIDLILEARDSMGILLSSHRMDVIERVADAAVVLHEGRLLAFGSLSEVAEQLAGSTWIVQGQFEPPHSFPAWIVRREGKTIMTVRSSDDEELGRILTGMSVARRPATIGEAMSYHLRVR